jgi:hypothetical protein
MVFFTREGIEVATGIYNAIPTKQQKDEKNTQE